MATMTSRTGALPACEIEGTGGFDKCVDLHHSLEPLEFGRHDHSPMILKPAPVEVYLILEYQASPADHFSLENWDFNLCEK